MDAMQELHLFYKTSKIENLQFNIDFDLNSTIHYQCYSKEFCTDNLFIIQASDSK